MDQHDIVEEDNRKSLQDWWDLHAELSERGVDLSRDYILKTVNGMTGPELRIENFSSTWSIAYKTPRTH